jgi:signal transduction histidine kinase
MLVHDLKNRVGSTIVAITALEQDMTEPSERTRKLLNTLHRSADRVLLQIHALLDIRRIQEGKMRLAQRRLALDRLLASAVDEHAEAARLVGVDLDVAAAPAPDLEVLVDPDIFSRILSNLLWNAMAHAPRGSRIDIGAVRGENEQVFIQVANHGPVLPEEVRAHLFEAFSSQPHPDRGVDTGGTGLGLTFCKLAVEAHGGSIRLDSPWPGQSDGVRVTLTLPLHSAANVSPV